MAQREDCMENDTRFEKTKPFLKSWKKDYIFKTMASTVLSFSVTILFALYNGFLGVCLLSIWHGGICVFYLLLAAIRGIILLTEKNNRTRSEKQKSECRQRTFMISAAMLLLLNLSLILPISLMVVMKKPVNMRLIPAITMAAYTTYKLTMASIHIHKQKRSNRNNILVTELRIINFIDALVSILTLQNTLIMVNQTKSNDNDMLTLSAISSAVIYIVIIFITVNLLIKGLKRKQ